MEQTLEVEENRIGYSVHNLGECQYATDSSFFDLKHILGTSGAQSQLLTTIPNVSNLLFNFCETPVIKGEKCLATFDKDKCSGSDN